MRDATPPLEPGPNAPDDTPAEPAPALPFAWTAVAVEEPALEESALAPAEPAPPGTAAPSDGANVPIAGDAAPALPRPRPLLPGHAVVLTAVVTLTFLMFLLIEPTPRVFALFGAAVAALGVDGVLRAARRRSFDLGLDPSPQLFLPALYALALPVFIEHNTRGLWVPLAGLAAGAGFGAIVVAEVHSVRPYEERFALARLVSGAAAYLTAFALFSLTYAFDLDLVPAIVAAALVSGLLSIELLRDGAADPQDTLGFAAVTALVVGELRWSLHYVPLDGHLAALALLLGFFFASGVLHAHLTRQLQRAVLAEYTAIVLAGVLLVWLARATDLA